MTPVLANIFQPLIDVFDHVIVFFHDTIGLSWGFSIIALTVAVRLVLMPLTFKQFKSMARLQELAPKVKELQEKYKDDKQRLNQEMMKFYRENQVNPLGSCLPLLLQLPVFIALFYMLRKDLKVDICGPDASPPGNILATAARQGTDIAHTYCDQVVPGSAQFGFIPDLTAPATGWVLAVLLVLYVGSQLFSSVLMAVTTDKTQRTIMLALPFVFVIFIHTFPAGLLVYWITTNIWTVGQQLFVRRALGQPMPWVQRREQAAAKAEGKPVGAAALTGASSGSSGGAKTAAPTAAPPPPPRRKKKRSGRRR
jgi:YidC/Oxa1 family membrane protein insertase